MYCITKNIDEVLLIKKKKTIPYLFFNLYIQDTTSTERSEDVGLVVS